MTRIQIAPEIEFKMEIDLGIDPQSRDYDVQQHKSEVYQALQERLEKAFPEGFKIHTMEFGIDTGWHEELKDADRDDVDDDRPVIV